MASEEGHVKKKKIMRKFLKIKKKFHEKSPPSDELYAQTLRVDMLSLPIFFSSKNRNFRKIFFFT